MPGSSSEPCLNAVGSSKRELPVNSEQKFPCINTELAFWFSAFSMFNVLWFLSCSFVCLNNSSIMFYNNTIYNNPKIFYPIDQIIICIEVELDLTIFDNYNFPGHYLLIYLHNSKTKKPQASYPKSVKRVYVYFYNLATCCTEYNTPVLLVVVCSI